MLPLASHDEPALDAAHPCFGCTVRERAVCRILGCTDLAAFRRLGSTLRLRTGQMLFHEGDPASRVFTVTRGSMKLYRLLPDGRRQITGFAFPGDFLGLSLEEEHSFSAETLQDAQLCWFPRTRFGAFVAGHSHMEGQLYRLAARELDAVREQMVLLGRKTALERLATFFFQRLDHTDRAGDGEADVFDLPMNRSDVADYLGLTKETVSRIFTQLRAMRLIRLIGRDRVRVLDRPGLARIAEGGG